jgi:phosphatidylglycerophosphatase A
MGDEITSQTNESSSGAVAPTPFSRPLQFLAFGFGSGLSPWAPGTMGTLVAVPLYLLVAHWSLPAYSLFIVVTAILGIWFCGAASRQLNVHDHPGIVWDEFVGYWITLWALPASWTWIVAGFVVFRIFDIAKPWPISLLDKKVKGGFGIMIDDIVAGVLACATLHLVRALV